MMPGGLHKRDGKSRWPGHYDENYAPADQPLETVGVVLPELALEWLVFRPGAFLLWCAKAGRTKFRHQLRRSSQNALAGVGLWIALAGVATWMLL